MRFFDFCSGIGGGRIALEAAGHTCVGYCEKDKTADVIFSYLTGDCRGFGDIMLLDPSRLPDFDIMLAGFPYKNFSASGKRDGFNSLANCQYAPGRHNWRLQFLQRRISR